MGRMTPVGVDLQKKKKRVGFPHARQVPPIGAFCFSLLLVLFGLQANQIKMAGETLESDS